MNRFKKYGIPVLIILLAMGAVRAMVKRKSEPAKVQLEKVVPTVSVMLLEKNSTPLTVHGTALVEPFEMVTLVPEVRGKVSYVSEKLTSGAQIAKGEKLIKIEDRDYRLNLQSVKTNYENAKLGLLMEQEESRIAKTQWEEYQKRNPKATASLFTLREPQLKKAEVTLKSAEAQVGLAQLNVNRTVIKAPFDAVAVTKNVDKGQVVAGTPLATLYGTARAKLEVALSKEDVDLLGDVIGQEVTVSTAINYKSFSWKGTVLGVSPQLNPRSRMVDLIVTVEKPLTQNSEKALQFGLFVDVSFKEAVQSSYFSIPRKALIDGRKVRLLQNGRLKIKQVQFITWDGEVAQVRSELNEGDTLITSSLDLTVDGMEVKVAK